jgi:tetratricopeptide (TPR) repeat protein
MRARAFVLLVSGLLVTSAALWSEGAEAGKDGAKPAAKSESGKSEGKGKSKYDPANRTAPSEVVATCAQGTSKFADKDVDGAIALFRKAIEIDGGNPLGHYLLAEALASQGKLADAETALEGAERSADKLSGMREKVLFLQADLKERQKKWPEAKAAWERLAALEGGRDAGVPSSAQARVAAISKVLELGPPYEGVRARIAAEKDGGAPAKP